MTDIISFFYLWCVKNKLQPQFDVRPRGPKHRRRFFCEARVEGHDYVGAGNSTNKKDSQSNAAKDFVQYLVRKGLVNSKDVPWETGLVAGVGDSGEPQELPSSAPMAPHLSLGLTRPVFQPGMGPNEIGEAYRPYQHDGDRPFTYIDRLAEQKKVSLVFCQKSKANLMAQMLQSYVLLQAFKEKRKLTAEEEALLKNCRDIICRMQEQTLNTLKLPMLENVNCIILIEPGALLELNPSTNVAMYTPMAFPSATSKNPCRDDYSGPYKFNVQLNDDTSMKNRWLYSCVLKKVYVSMLSKLSFQFKWTQGEAGLLVRAMLVYCSQDYFDHPVMRCPSHSSRSEACNAGIEHVEHVMRCDHDRAIYQKDLNNHLSVVVPLDVPHAGTDWVTVLYTFVCKNSCTMGMNRRTTDIIFTLERLSGEIIGRKTMGLLVCTCPKREKANEETYYFLKTEYEKSSSQHLSVPMPGSVTKPECESEHSAESDELLRRDMDKHPNYVTFHVPHQHLWKVAEIGIQLALCKVFFERK